MQRNTGTRLVSTLQYHPGVTTAVQYEYASRRGALKREKNPNILNWHILAKAFSRMKTEIWS